MTSSNHSTSGEKPNYKLTPEAAAAVEAWWPADAYRGKGSRLGREFEHDMRNLQCDETLTRGA